MKTLGLIGGIGWEATVLHYRLIYEEVGSRFGSLHSAPMNGNRLEFQTPEAQVKANRWNGAARTLQGAGAEAPLLCSNRMHDVFEAVAGAVAIPALHIGDAVFAEARAARMNRIGLIGARFTPEHGFLPDSIELHVLAAVRWTLETSPKPTRTSRPTSALTRSRPNSRFR